LEEEAKKLQIQDKILPIFMDVVQHEQIDNAVEQVTAFLNKTGLPLVGIVNNAGVSTRFPVEAIPMKEARRLFEVNFFWDFGSHSKISSTRKEISRKNRVY